MNSLKRSPHIVAKVWGSELHYHDAQSGVYFKILRFDEGACLSFHMHLDKAESMYVIRGMFKFTWIHSETAEHITESFMPGDVIHIWRGLHHKIECVEAGEIAEASTPDNPADSYRIEPSKPGKKA